MSQGVRLNELVDKATAEHLTSEDWQLNMNVCDLVSRYPNGAQDCANAILRRIQHRNPTVACLAVTLAEACVKNCGLFFQREVAQGQFLSTIVRMSTDRSVSYQVREKLLGFIQDCANEFKDPSLSYLNMEYQNMKRQGAAFPASTYKKSEPAASKELSKEEEDLQLALALSMSELETKKNQSKPLPSIPQNSGPNVVNSVLFIVKALYDFAGQEQDELGFRKGDLIDVLEKLDSNWWKGELKRKPGTIGIFPSNYVEMYSNASQPAEDRIEDDLNIENIDALLQLLMAVNPQKENISKNDKIQDLFQECNDMKPKIADLVNKYNKKKDDLLDLNEQFMKAKTTYERVLAYSIAQKIATQPGYVYSQQQYPTNPGPQHRNGLPYGVPQYLPPGTYPNSLPPGQPNMPSQYPNSLPPGQPILQQQQQQSQHYPTQPPPSTHQTSFQQPPNSFAPSAPPPSPSSFPQPPPQFPPENNTSFQGQILPPPSTGFTQYPVNYPTPNPSPAPPPSQPQFQPTQPQSQFQPPSPQQQPPQTQMPIQNQFQPNQPQPQNQFQPPPNQFQPPPQTNNQFQPPPNQFQLNQPQNQNQFQSSQPPSQFGYYPPQNSNQPQKQEELSLIDLS